MDTFYTADPHYNHDAVIQFVPRKFRTVTDMDETLLHETNSIVGKDDRLVVVGDAAFSTVEAFRKLRAKIICRNVWLIWGNHDRPGYGDACSESYDTYEFRSKCANYRIFASHYPHAIWPSSHRGSLHVYGHCHGQREEWLDEIMPGRRSMDVGVDTAYRILGAYRPFRETEVIDILGSRPGHHFPEEIEHHVAKKWSKEYGVPVRTLGAL